MKRVSLLLREIAALSILLGLLLYLFLNFSCTHLATGNLEKGAININFFNSQGIALFYTVTIVILLFLFNHFLKNVFDLKKFTYLFGFLIATGFIVSFKVVTGTFDLSDKITIIEIAIVIIFGLLVSRIMSKYLM